MDPPLTPPLRIQPFKAQSISERQAQKGVQTFLENFQGRSTSAQGGNTAVTVQLQKLAMALKDERKKRS